MPFSTRNLQQLCYTFSSRPHRLTVRTSPFQGGNTGSIPVGGTIRYLSLSFSFISLTNLAGVFMPSFFMIFIADTLSSTI